MTRSSARLAIVGYGAVARRHGEVFRALGAELVASCNRSDAGREAARNDGILATYSDPPEMVERTRPDGILVTASALHQYSLVEALIPHGIPLLVEKPPGVSLAQARRLSVLAAQFPVPIMVAMNRRFYSVYHAALKELGGVEAITAVGVEWSENVATVAALHPADVVRRLVFCNSLHGLDLLVFFGGAPRDVNVSGRNLDGGGLSFRWQMRLMALGEHAAYLRFDSTWDAPGPWRLVLDAPGARVVSSPLECAAISRRLGQWNQLVPSPEDLRYKAGFYHQAAAFLNLIRGTQPLRWPACSIDQVIPSMELAERLTLACEHQVVNPTVD